MTQGENTMRELFLIERMQKIALVFLSVCSFKELIFAGLEAALGIMPRCQQIRAALLGIMKKYLKLDFFIAKNIWIRRAASAIFLQEIAEDLRPIFLGKIDAMQLNFQLV